MRPNCVLMGSSRSLTSSHRRRRLTEGVYARYKIASFGAIDLQESNMSQFIPVVRTAFASLAFCAAVLLLVLGGCSGGGSLGGAACRQKSDCTVPDQLCFGPADSAVVG